MSVLFQVVETGAVETITNSISGNISWLIIGIVFFIAAAFVISVLKNIVVNTALGLLGWGLLTYVFHIDLPFWASLLISAVFGLAGLGALVVLGFLGIIWLNVLPFHSLISLAHSLFTNGRNAKPNSQCIRPRGSTFVIHQHGNAFMRRHALDHEV